MDYSTITTVGNATDFGNLTVGRNQISGSGSSTRGVFSTGQNPGSGGVLDVTDYITIASTSNATDFGDATAAKDACGSAGSSIRTIIAGGTTGSLSNVIEYFTIASTGDGADFGDLQEAVAIPSGFSDAGGHL